MAVVAFQPGPGARVLALWCDDEAEWDELRRVCESGEMSFDGNAVGAALDPASSRAALFIRFTLAGPYVPPPLVLGFEDATVATRIGETGWYAFEGGLFRARNLGGGRVALDRVYESEPPATYHGRALDGIGTLDQEPSTKETA